MFFLPKNFLKALIWISYYRMPTWPYFSFVEKWFLIYTIAKNLKHEDLELRILWFNDTLNYISNPIIKGETS